MLLWARRRLALARRAHARSGRSSGCAREGRAGAPGLPGHGPPGARPGTASRRAPGRRSPSRASAGSRASCVHFNRGWVPYDEREAYLLEADIGVCAHHDHLEARFSFRTRVLDHFWAGPALGGLTAGDAIGELVERRGLGRAVAPEDDEGFARRLRGAARRCGTPTRRRPRACASWRRRCAGARWRARWSTSASDHRERPAAASARPRSRGPPTGSTRRSWPTPCARRARSAWRAVSGARSARVLRHGA